MNWVMTFRNSVSACVTAAIQSGNHARKPLADNRLSRS